METGLYTCDSVMPHVTVRYMCVLVSLSLCTSLCMCVCYCRVSHDKRVKELSHQLRDVTQQRDLTSQQLTELKVQHKIIEDCRDSVKRDLAEASDNIRRGNLIVHRLISCTEAIFSMLH